MKEHLNTDRVNYLIWRYLIESDYRGTAAKLQKEWGNYAPHRNLDFAPHVTVHALVTVLSKGLLFEEYERQYETEARQQGLHGVPGTSDAVPRGVFGPLTFDPAGGGADADGELDAEGEYEDDEEELYDADAADELENPRKRPSDGQHRALPIGSPAKRPRLGNGLENGAVANGAHGAHEPDGPTRMDVDQDYRADHSTSHAYPSPLDGEQAASPPRHTDSRDQGTQVPRVHQLAADDTTYLLTGADGRSHGPPLPAPPASQPPAENPIVLHGEWSPKNPSILAAAGGDALARVWNVPQPLGSPGPLTNHVNGNAPDHADLLIPAKLGRALVTAMAWHPAGDTLALALEHGDLVTVGTWSVSGAPIDEFGGPEPPVVKMRWSIDGQFLFWVSPNKKGALLTVYVSESRLAHTYQIPNLDLECVDAIWTTEREVLVCGGDVLACVQVTDDGLLEGRRFATTSGEALCLLAFDSYSELVATASEKGLVHIWDHAGQRRTLSAHMGLITSIQWQPLGITVIDGVADEKLEAERLLASGGEDGAICIWNARSQETKPKYSMTMDSPVVGVAMTPDGEFIATAAGGRVLIWRIGEHAFPFASWKPDPQPGWLSPKSNGAKPNGVADEEDLVCLAWNKDGRKLMYGAATQLAVIHFR